MYRSRVQEIKTMWEKYTLQEADSAVDFFDSGGDSLSAIKLIVDLKKIFDIDISLEKFMRHPTLDFLFEISKKIAVNNE